jgi:hypothetical protein
MQANTNTNGKAGYLHAPCLTWKAQLGEMRRRLLITQPAL